MFATHEKLNFHKNSLPLSMRNNINSTKSWHPIFNIAVYVPLSKCYKHLIGQTSYNILLSDALCKLSLQGIFCRDKKNVFLVRDHCTVSEWEL